MFGFLNDYQNEAPESLTPSTDLPLRAMPPLSRLEKCDGKVCFFRVPLYGCTHLFSMGLKRIWLVDTPLAFFQAERISMDRLAHARTPTIGPHIAHSVEKLF